MEQVLPFEGQMNQRLVPCNDCSAYKIVQDYWLLFFHRVDMAQYGQAHVCVEILTMVRDNTHNNYLRVVLQVGVNPLASRMTIKAPALVVRQSVP
jgi:hypothetical protein